MNSALTLSRDRRHGSRSSGRNAADRDSRGRATRLLSGNHQAYRCAMPSSRVRLVLLLLVVAACGLGCKKKKVDPNRATRDALYKELQPVALKNCTLKRFGSVNDGGYAMCENLIAGVESAYSYGIEHEDNWGCQLSRDYKVAIHQYDCFTEDRPTCPEGQFIFHDECVGAKAETIDGHLFDSVTGQITKNGDKGKRIIMKMDVEGAEWDSFLATSDEVFERIDQLIMELHGVNEQKHVDVVRKLKKNFHVVAIHFNNWECTRKVQPFPSAAYQVLFVNKRLGEVDPNGKPHISGQPPHAPDNPNGDDCQTVPPAKKKA